MVNIANIVDGVVNGLEELKISDISVYDVALSSHLTDFFIVSTADSIIQLGAARTKIDDFMRKNKFPIKNPNEKWEGGWLIMDFVDIVVNVFLEEKRSFYAIDDLLRAGKIDFDEITNAHS